MSLSKTTLDAIQKAGAAVFEADTELKLAVKVYAERVHAAVGSNPYHLGNDALFENWKLVARLSQTMTGMEEELRKVYQVASELNDDASSTVTTLTALPAPTPSSPAEVLDRMDHKAALAATDVKIKKKAKSFAAKPARKNTAPKKRAKAAGLPLANAAQTNLKPVVSSPLPSNAVTLLKHLGAVLNAKDFTKFNQTKVSRTSGIPLGSMNASLKRLLADGHLLPGPAGQYKLAR